MDAVFVNGLEALFKKLLVLCFVVIMPIRIDLDKLVNGIVDGLARRLSDVCWCHHPGITWLV
jgi:hypothetical protein